MNATSCSMAADRGALGLGIDAGGTYTDAVLYDFSGRRLVAKAKALTTHHDLAIGIGKAIGLLPVELVGCVAVTALSTTLATNAVVEGRGGQVGLLVLSPWDWTQEDFDFQPVIRIPGCVGIEGAVLEPLDEAAARQAIGRLLYEERCAAIAVAGYASFRNPQQELRVRELVREQSDVPVVCAHDISRRMNMYQAAQTAIANARLIPLVHRLLDDVRLVLNRVGVCGPIMVVKGDGTVVAEAVARERPVETILSGPAASVSGARLLSGLDEAVVVDIGGTTTDCAVIRNGRPAHAAEGVRIGNWVMAVDAMEMSSVGLGGDSRLDFSPDRVLRVGPRRALPLCCLAMQRPEVREWLERFDPREHIPVADASALDVLTLNASVIAVFTEQEQRLLDMLADGPMPAVEACRRMDLPVPRHLPLDRLEALGIVLRSALTPTDLMHAAGRFDCWDAVAARLALAAFAGLMGRDPDVVERLAWDAVSRRLYEEIIRCELALELDRRAGPESWLPILDKAFADAAPGSDAAGLSVSFKLRRPLVAVGAPASVMAPDAASRLGARLVVPPNSDVANALGAIAGEIEVCERLVIRADSQGSFVVYGAADQIKAPDLDEASRLALVFGRARAVDRAKAAGAPDPAVIERFEDRHSIVSDGSRIFVERRVLVVARGQILGRVPGPVQNPATLAGSANIHAG